MTDPEMTPEEEARLRQFCQSHPSINYEELTPKGRSWALSLMKWLQSREREGERNRVLYCGEWANSPECPPPES